MCRDSCDECVMINNILEIVTGVLVCDDRSLLMMCWW